MYVYRHYNRQMLFTLILSFVIVNDSHLRPILDVEYTKASVRVIPNEIMRRVLNTNVNGNDHDDRHNGGNVIVRGFLATQDTNTNINNNNNNVIRTQLNDDDVSVKTIFYDDHTIKDVTNQHFDDNVIVHTIINKDNDRRYNKPIYNNNNNVKTSYDVPLHSVEALPPVNLQEHQVIDQNLPQIDIRFGDDTSHSVSQTGTQQEMKINTQANNLINTPPILNVQIHGMEQFDPISILKSSIPGFAGGKITKAIPRVVVST